MSPVSIWDRIRVTTDMRVRILPKAARNHPCRWMQRNELENPGTLMRESQLLGKAMPNCGDHVDLIQLQVRVRRPTWTTRREVVGSHSRRGANHLGRGSDETRTRRGRLYSARLNLAGARRRNSPRPETALCYPSSVALASVSYVVEFARSLSTGSAPSTRVSQNSGIHRKSKQ